MLIAKKFDELSAKEIYEILKARAAIFVVEQQIVYQDMDDRDFESLHVFCEENGIVTAYLRAFEVAPDVVKMGRVLTLQHGQGLGKKLLEFGLEEIKKFTHRRASRSIHSAMPSAFMKNQDLRYAPVSSLKRA